MDVLIVLKERQIFKIWKDIANSNDLDDKTHKFIGYQVLK